MRWNGAQLVGPTGFFGSGSQEHIYKNTTQTATTCIDVEKHETTRIALKLDSQAATTPQLYTLYTELPFNDLSLQSI